VIRILVLALVAVAACGKPAPQRPYELDLTSRLRGTTKDPAAAPRDPTPTPDPAAPLVTPPRE
jgi:hypothetical protein